MTFKLIEKETGKDVTERYNVCLHHSGMIVQLVGQGLNFKVLDSNRFEIVMNNP